MKTTITLIAALAVAAVYSIAAEAHTLQLQCKKIGGDQVTCRAHFTDGEIARGMAVQLIDENDKVLATGKTDVEGKYSFKAPAPEYNVVIQASRAEVTSISSEDIW